MIGWFNTPERVAALKAEAWRWVGTPFFANSDTPGPNGGVSCQKLASAIYKAVGCCEVETPEVQMSHARFSREGLLEPFMAKQTKFARLASNGDLQAGDLV